MVKKTNKADKLVFKALQKALKEDKLHFYLINSKINIPGSPIYNPWESLLPSLCPLLVGLFLIWLAGILWGLVFMIAGLLLSANFVKKKMEQRLFERAKQNLSESYESCCALWNFGGVVLVKEDEKKQACISPDANWKEFIVLNFADFMTDKKEAVEPENDNEKAA